MDTACPYKSFKIQSKKNSTSGWITKGILVSRKKLKFYGKLITQIDDENFSKYYKSYKQIYRRVIRAAKSLEVNNKLKSSKNISKTAWQIINGNKTSNKSMSPTELELDGIKFTSPSQLAH